MRPRKTLEKLIGGSRNIRFGDMQTLVEAYGFKLTRVRGSHHVYLHPDIRELINLQNVGGQTKPYQIRQFLKLVEEYNLRLEDAES